AAGAPGIRRYARQRDSFLSCAQHGAARHHRMGPGEVQVRQYHCRRERKASIRPVLHQEHVARPGPDDHVSDRQDCVAGPGSAMTAPGMKWVFWFQAALITYTYCGYPSWLWLRARFRGRPVRAASFTPSISMVMVVRNEAAVIEGKVKNLLGLDYPSGFSEIVVVSDGSTDVTNEVLNYYAADSRVRVVVNPISRGKAACLNDAIGAARGEIVLFTDARQQLE